MQTATVHITVFVQLTLNDFYNAPFMLWASVLALQWPLTLASAESRHTADIRGSPLSRFLSPYLVVPGTIIICPGPIKRLIVKVCFYSQLTESGRVLEDRQVLLGEFNKMGCNIHFLTQSKELVFCLNLVK